MQEKDFSNQLIMLGTGNAVVTRCYNTCFAIRQGNEYLLVDAGGGNGIMSRLELAGIGYNSIRNMFVTHAHTDHILGAVWVVRMIAQAMNKGKYDGDFTVYGNDKVIIVLTTICSMTLPKKITRLFGERITFVEVRDGVSFEASGMEVTCFDIHSTKEKQFGFSAMLGNGRRLACLGDEPYNEVDERYVKGADWLLCEAFCLYRDKDIFSPYEKHHSTALDAGRVAAGLEVRNLVLYHTEDTDLSNRRKNYSEEAAREFSGNIFVPDDLDVIDL